MLQLYLPQRFGWWPVQTAKLGKRSAASFTLHPRGRLRARVRYTLPDGATTLATSRDRDRRHGRARAAADQRSPPGSVFGASSSLPLLVTRRTTRGSRIRASAASQYTRGT